MMRHELSVLGKPFQWLFLPHGIITLNVGEHLWLQHKECPLIQPSRIWGFSVSSVTLSPSNIM